MTNWLRVGEFLVSFQFSHDVAVGIISIQITSANPMMRGAVAITSAKTGCASLAGGTV